MDPNSKLSLQLGLHDWNYVENYDNVCDIEMSIILDQMASSVNVDWGLHFLPVEHKNQDYLL